MSGCITWVAGGCARREEGWAAHVHPAALGAGDAADDSDVGAGEGVPPAAGGPRNAAGHHEQAGLRALALLPVLPLHRHR